MRQALRKYLLDVIEADLFAIGWSDEDEPVLTAMDPSGQVVTAFVCDELDDRSLIRALARAGETSALPWSSIAAKYESGVEAFQRDWNTFRQARPPGARPGPSVYIVAGRYSETVVDAMRVLHGIQVFCVDARLTARGQQILDVTPLQPAAVRVLDSHAPMITPQLSPGEKQGAADTPSATSASSAQTPGTAEAPGSDAAPMAAETPASALSPTPTPAVTPAAPTQTLTAEEVRAAGSGHPAADRELQAVAQLLGAPIDIQFRDASGQRDAVLTGEGTVNLGDHEAYSLAEASSWIGADPGSAWQQWTVAGFALEEARAEAAASATVGGANPASSGPTSAANSPDSTGSAPAETSSGEVRSRRRSRRSLR